MSDELTNETNNESQIQEPQAAETPDADGSESKAEQVSAETPEVVAETEVEAAPVSVSEEAPETAPENAAGKVVAEQGKGRPATSTRGAPADKGVGLTAEGTEIEDQVVKVYRCATVVKGGRRFSFSALVVVGDRNGRVGIGYGKANEVPNAVEKAAKSARHNMVKINLSGTTIPHRVLAKYSASKVLLIPASEGTGVIAGDSVRAVMELAGVKDVLTKVYGSTSPKNLVKAAFKGLISLRSRESVEKLRDVSIA